MKLKHTLVAAAVGLAFAAPASAIDSPSSGNGGLFLTAWDSNPDGVVGRGTQGYGRDLGITLDQFLANPNVDLTFAADPLFVSNFAGIPTADILWNITAGDRVNPNRELTTGIISGVISNGALNNGILQRQIPLVTKLNGLGNCGAGGSCDFNDNTDPQWPGGVNWSFNFGGNIANLNDAQSVGVSNFFNYLPQNGTGQTSLTLNVTPQRFFIDNGLQLLSFVGTASTWILNTDGSIGFDGTAPAPEVPVPAAVWLFGSGLLGLAGVARRKNKVA